MAQSSSATGTGSTADKIEATKDAAREEVGRLSRDAKKLAHDASERGSELVDGALEAGRDYAARARSEAEHVYDVGQKRAEEAAFYAELGYEEAADMVRRHPVQAMGLAVGVGVLIGLLIARR